MEELLKPSEVMRLLKISRRTFYRWISEDKIRVVRLPSGQYRVPKSEVEKLCGKQ